MDQPFALATPHEAERETAADACADALREAIVKGEVRAGARLPPERTLAERFGVNRVTVRAALARLASERLLSVRQGSGYTVRDYRRTAGTDLVATLAGLAKTAGDRAVIVRDLLFVRRMLARGVFERLSEGVPEEGLVSFEAAIDALEQVAREKAPVAELARADLDVAFALVAATGSTVLSLAFNPVAGVLARLPELQRAIYGDPMWNVAAWRGTLAWARAPRKEVHDVMLAALEAKDEEIVRALQTRAPMTKKRRVGRAT